MTYNELSKRVKNKLREKYRYALVNGDWYEPCYEDFERVGNIIGVTFSKSSVGEHLTDIWFSGFSCQGDGLNFSGWFTQEENITERIKEYAPEDVVLHGIAEKISAAQISCWLEHGCYVRADIEAVDCYYINVTPEFDDNENGPWKPFDENLDELVISAIKEFQQWMYKQLEQEHNYLTSDEAVDEWLSENYDLSSLEKKETL